MANPTPIEVQKYLSGIDYPASKDELVEAAKSEGAEGDVLQALQDLPDQEYDAPTAVSKAIAA